MSLRTWKKEFYPKNPTKKMSKVEAIEHSLLKWEGLKNKNLKKHKVEVLDRFIRDYVDNLYFEINSESCALCKKYYNSDSFSLDRCLKCPLFSVLGNQSCDNGGNPYDSFIDNGSPVPMINALKKALKKTLKEEIGT